MNYHPKNEPFDPLDYTLSALDLSFFNVETNERPQNIAALAKFEGRLERETLNHKLTALIHTYPRLKACFSPTLLKYDASSFNEPIREIYLDENVSINIAVSKLLMKDSFFKNRLWGLTLIHSNTGQSYVLFTLHHSLADGVSGLGFFNQLFFKRKIKTQESLKTNNNPATNIPVGKSLFSLFKEAIQFSPHQKTLKQETRERHLVFISVTRVSFNQLRKKLQVSSQTLNLTLAALIFKQLYPKEKLFRALVPVALKTMPEAGVLGNFIGGASIDIDIPSVEIKKVALEIEKKLKVKLTPESYGAYYFFAALLKKLPKSIADGIAKIAAKKITAIVTSLSGPKISTQNSNPPLSAEFAIPALMPYQNLAFGFMKNHSTLDITLITDQNFSLDANQIKVKIDNLFSSLDLTYHSI